jgi:preprotein translocase subunit SecE
MIAKTKRFLQEVRAELAKATWPWDPKEKGFKKYRELTDSTTVVIIGMLLMGGYVAFFDLILVSVVSALTGMGK